jgi:hypothetical protein
MQYGGPVAKEHVFCVCMLIATFICFPALEAPVWMDEDLRVSLNPLVKLLIRYRGIIDVDLVRNDEAGLRLARNDEIAKVAIVRLHIALAGAQ